MQMRAYKMQRRKEGVSQSCSAYRQITTTVFDDEEGERFVADLVDGLEGGGFGPSDFVPVMTGSIRKRGKG